MGSDNDVPLKLKKQHGRKLGESRVEKGKTQVHPAAHGAVACGKLSCRIAASSLVFCGILILENILS